MLSSVPSKKPTTAAAMKAVSRLSCSHGWRNFRLRGHGVASRSSFSTPTMRAGLRAQLDRLRLEQRLRRAPCP